MTQPTNIDKALQAAWKQHVKDMEKYSFKDPQKYKQAFDEIVTSTYLQAVEYGRISVLEDFDSIMKADAFMGLSAEEWKAVQKFFRYNDEISGWKQSLKQTK